MKTFDLVSCSVAAGLFFTGCINNVCKKEGMIMAAPKAYTVQDTPGYNSWPMIQNAGSRLICAYSKGKEHRIEEPCRGVYARFSDDGGVSWSSEVTVCDSDKFGQVTIGKGADRDGAVLFWVRNCKAWDFPFELHHELYRTVDGVTFEKISAPQLDPSPMQITDIFHIPEKNELMALWFAGDYKGGNNNSWGTLISTDNGITWKQQIIESGLPKNEWPTEQSAVYLGDGRIIAIARREGGDANRVQFQLQSTDHGRTWSKKLTNINDIRESTPSLILTADGKICNYYYQRGAGLLKRRVVEAGKIWDNPTSWPEPEIITTASTDGCHAGNVNAVAAGGRHLLSYYTGNKTDTAVVVFPAELPR